MAIIYFCFPFKTNKNYSFIIVIIPLQYLIQVMFLQEFQDQTTQAVHKNKKVKKEYSAGFRNYHPKKHSAFDEQIQNTSADSDIFDQLKIGNLKQLYMQSQPTINLQSQIIQQQQKSILRLVSRPQKKPNHQQENQQKNIKDQPRFIDTYHKVVNFEENANKTLFKSQFNKIQAKLKKQFKEKSTSQDFIGSIIKFILVQQKQLTEKELSIDSLLLQYTNFLNQHIQQKQSVLSIEKHVLESILQKNVYLYSIFKIGTFEQSFDHFGLKKIIRNEQQINILSNDPNVLALLNKKYTIPYQSSPHQQNRSLNKKDIIKPQESKPYIFHAEPVPQTTYQPPKERPKSAIKAKTVAEPFNLTDNHKKEQKKMEDYYKWERNFKPRGIPKTTYQPQQIVLLDEAQKKRRATELLQSAAFPSTMKYLQNYNKYNGERQEQLKNRYWKTHQTFNSGDKIPDFQQIHYQQMVSLQTRKTQNRHPTKQQPFNLSQPKPRKQKQSHQQLNQVVRQQKDETSKIKKSSFVPQSTLKYQAYVKHIKSEKQQKQRIRNDEKKKAIKQDGEKKVLNDILKERIDQQVLNLPKNKINPQSLTSNSVKVNLQKIYINEPLLIEREAAKNKKNSIIHKKDWAPII